MAAIIEREAPDIMCHLMKEQYYNKGIKPKPVQVLDPIINIL